MRKHISAFCLVLAIIGASFSLWTRNIGHKSNPSEQFRQEKVFRYASAPEGKQRVEQLSVRQRRERNARTFASANEVTEFLGRPGRRPLDFAVCAILSKDKSFLDKARKLEPSNEQIHLLSLLFDKAYLEDPALIAEFSDLHPESAWPALLQSSVALSKGDTAGALEYLAKTQAHQTLESNEVAVKKSITDFLVEIRDMDFKAARLTSVAGFDNSFSTYRVCDDLASALSVKAIDLLKSDPEKALLIQRRLYL